MLVDEMFGVIRRVTRMSAFPGEPAALHGFSAAVGDLGRVSRWAPDVLGSGVNFDADRARHAAIGEAVERYCGNMVTVVDRRATPAELRKAGLPFLDPTRLPLFTAEQYKRPGFPFRPLADDVVVPWVRGQALRDGAPVLLPAPSVYLNYYRGSGDPAGAQRRFPVLLPGIAAGPDLPAAIRSALLEIVERDTTVLWWIGRRPALVVEFPRGHLVRDLTSVGLDPAVRLWWLYLPGDLPVPTLGCVLVDERLGVLAVGFATRATVTEAALKAAAEAFQLRRLAAACLDPHSWLWRGAAQGRLHFPLRPYRADRSYTREFAADWSDMTQLMHNTQYFLDPDSWDHALSRLTPPDSVDCQEVPGGGDVPGGADWPATRLAAAWAEVGMSVYAADLTTPDVAACGYRVARVIAPEAVPNLPTAFPPLAAPRLRARFAGSADGGGFDLSPLPHS